MSIIRVRTPATSANLGSGFDTLGLALRLHNVVVIEPSEDDTEILITGEGADALPRSSTHQVLRTMQRLYQEIGRSLPPLRLRQENAIPLARGLGSSSAAVAAGLVGANALAGHPLAAQDLLNLAAELDGHPDNVAACLLGGMVITAMEGVQVHFARLPVPRKIRLVLYVPDFESSTPAARRRLPHSYRRGDVVFNLGRVALTTAAFAAGRWELLGLGMQDRIHQPYRAEGYPALPELIRAALSAGARGAALSGSGPTILALTDGDPAPIAQALTECAARLAMRGRTLTLSVDSQGTLLL